MIRRAVFTIHKQMASSMDMNMTRRFSQSVRAMNVSEQQPLDPKIDQIVTQISTLNLFETSILIKELKTRLNIADAPMPVMGMPMAAPADTASAAPVEEEKPKEKTEFAIKLEKFDAASKAKVIRELKALIPGMNLVEAKKFVESAPKVIKEGVSKADAEKIKQTLESVGATVVLE